ncbi:hypothetical protein PYW07_002603 [Mythimna separata]|uniref:Lysosomal protein NCU-G1 n=1 Tax=Mythimna separata TaxID=271217 RepID=A0AAD7YGK1_MYTSE|nr:hypothetical protein PYW07_002603 [Mythimna separata]
MHLHSLLIVFLLSFACGQDRRITPVLNPGCENCSTTLVYIKADGSQDTVHQLWDFTRGAPTIIYLITKQSTPLNISWVDELPDKFVLPEKPVYSFAASIDKLQEYNDIENNGHIDNKSPQRELPLRHVWWRRGEHQLSGKEAMLHMRGHFEERRQRGVLDMKLDLLPFKDYAVDLPHLIHTANSTLVDISLVNLTSSEDYNASRFAIHFLMVSTDDRSDSMTYSMRKSLDDEHTPGVFEIFEIKTPKSSRSDDGGFLQFRPVCYTEPERSVSSSTNAYITNFTRTSLPYAGTLRDFYRTFDGNNLLVQDMYISFGLPGDGFYRQHNYTSWSFTIGYGVPPVESFSLFVIIIISIGLGVPVLLALSGITYVLVRRCKQRNPPERFTDDE